MPDGPVKTQNVFHFKDGETFLLDLSYCSAQFNVGERVIIEGVSEIFVVDEIQNQFRKTPGGLKMIVRNVMLTEYVDFS